MPASARLDRARGSLVGLAVGDALGTALEFSPPGSFTPITGIVGGGPFGLRPGEWTDDTAMALCLAASLVEKNAFDPIDRAIALVRGRGAARGEEMADALGKQESGIRIQESGRSQARPES